MSTLFIFQETSRYKNQSLFCSVLFNPNFNCSVVDYGGIGLNLDFYLANVSFSLSNYTSALEANQALFARHFFGDLREQISYIYELTEGDIYQQQTIGFLANAIFLCVTMLLLSILICIAFCRSVPSKLE